MKRLERFFMALSVVLSLALFVPSKSYAMHIMEGYLPLGWSLFWGALTLPFIVWGIIKLRRIVSENRKLLIILAMIGAYVFVVSALKFPSLTGSSSHPTGTGLGAVLFGPAPMAIIGSVVLLFQAFLLAHGGITTLGANIFSMAIIGPLVSFGLYYFCQKIRISKSISVFIAVMIGDLMTYCVTAFQLALAHPGASGGVMGSFAEFLGVFAITQIPISAIDGILAVIVIIGLESYAKSELTELGYFKKLKEA